MSGPPRRIAPGEWIDGNAIQLLENGEEFFPRVFARIANAQREVVIETFILFEDKVGLQLHEALIAAARRGVQIDLTIDGFGSPDLSDWFLGSLHRAGVRVHVFDPRPRLLGWRYNVLRRMHRKIVVVDTQIAFVGGINYSADHLADFGPEAKQDYSAEIEGPLVAEIHRFCHAALAEGLRHQRMRHWWRRRALLRRAPDQLPRVGSASAVFVVRDNRRHMNDIEEHYRNAIRHARRRIIIANAYFFPGYRLIRELIHAAHRGVDVRLVLQGEPDMQVVKTAARTLYDHLLRAGLRIYEYGDRPLHGKIALIDEEWSTVGSSNLDPLSLALNLEANIVIRDRAFNEDMYRRLERLMAHSCEEVTRDKLGVLSGFAMVRSFFAYHLTRRYPGWFGHLPRHVPRLLPAHQPQPLDGKSLRPAWAGQEKKP